jgi:hypothetical protein
MNAKALLKQVDRRFDEWLVRRDAVYGLFRAYHREMCRAIWK